MLIVYGDSKTVNLAECCGTQVWTTGLHTPRNVLQTYQTTCISGSRQNRRPLYGFDGVYRDQRRGNCDVCRGGDFKGWDLSDSCSMAEGLWHLARCDPRFCLIMVYLCNPDYCRKKWWSFPSPKRAHTTGV